MVESAQISSSILESNRALAQEKLTTKTSEHDALVTTDSEATTHLGTLKVESQKVLDEKNQEKERNRLAAEDADRLLQDALRAKQARYAELYALQRDSVVGKIKRGLGFFFSKENFVGRGSWKERREWYNTIAVRNETQDARDQDEQYLSLRAEARQKRERLNQAEAALRTAGEQESTQRLELDKIVQKINRLTEEVSTSEEELQRAQEAFDQANALANERWEKFRIELQNSIGYEWLVEEKEKQDEADVLKKEKEEKARTAESVSSEREKILNKIEFHEAFELSRTENLRDEVVIGQLSERLNSIVEYYTRLAELGQDRDVNRSKVLESAKEKVARTVAQHLELKHVQFFQECDETGVEVLQREFNELQQRLDRHNENKRIGFVEALETPQALRELKARLKKVETQLKKQLSEQKTNKRRAEAAYAKYLESDELESYQNGLLDNELTMLDQVGEGFQKDWARLSPEELELITSGQLTDVLEYATKMQKNLGKWLEYAQNPNGIADRVMQQVRVREWSIEDVQRDIDNLNNELKQARASQREKEEEIGALEKILRRRKRVDKKNPTPKQQEKLDGLNEELEAIKLNIKQLEKDRSDSTQALEQTRKQHARTMQKVRDDIIPDELRFGLPSVQEAQAVSSGLGQFVEMYNAVMFGEHNRVEFPEFQQRFSIEDAKVDLRRAMEARKETAEQRDEAIESERNIAKEISGNVEAAKTQIEASIERILTLSVEQIKEPVGVEMRKVLHDLPLLHNDALLALAERADTGGELKTRIIALYEAVAGAADNPRVKRVYETMAKGLA